MRTRPLLTIGYGGREISQLIDLLRREKVRYVVDVRSYPVSRHRPEYSRGPLEQSLCKSGIRYIFLGDELGGRPDDPSCYDDDGHVDYLRCREREAFQAGIERLENAWRGNHRLALLCSEARPEDCHRTKLVAAALVEHGVDVAHIDADSEARSHEEVIERLQAAQLSLLATGARANRSRRAYR
jgi:uncharacterized protein (DUF488 family)